MRFINAIAKFFTGDLEHTERLPTDIALEFHVNEVFRVRHNMPLLCGELLNGTVDCGTTIDIEVNGSTQTFTVVDIAMYMSCVRSVTAHPEHKVPLGLLVRPFDADIESLPLPLTIRIRAHTE